MTVLLLECGIRDAAVLTATLLHDTVEDTNATLQEIERLFGKRVAVYVREVSDDKRLDKVTRKRQQVARIAKASVGAQMIKMADKWSNCKDLRTDPPKGWQEDDVMGYAIWSFTICQNVSPNVNTMLKKAVDTMFLKTFNLHTDRGNLDSRLQAYYKMCTS